MIILFIIWVDSSIWQIILHQNLILEDQSSHTKMRCYNETSIGWYRTVLYAHNVIISSIDCIGDKVVKDEKHTTVRLKEK